MKILALLLLILTTGFVSFGQKSETMSIKLYFSDERDDPDFINCARVRAVTRTIPKTKSVARAALVELFKGPTKQEEADELSSFFSEDTKDILISVKIKKGAAYVNFKEEVMQKLGNATTSCGSRSFHASIEKTLKQFPTIKKVFFAVEGSPADYYEWMQYDCPTELKNCSGSNF